MTTCAIYSQNVLVCKYLLKALTFISMVIISH